MNLNFKTKFVAGKKNDRKVVIVKYWEEQTKKCSI